jgi:small subunit ribosomal protein S3
VGQKIHPYGFRLGVIYDWKSRWFANRDYADLLQEDLAIRQYLKDHLRRAAVSRVEIERTVKRVKVDIFTARPGIVIGRRGSEVDRIKRELTKMTSKEVHVNIQEVNQPELDAYLVAQNISEQLVGRVSFRRAMKRAVQNAMRAGAKGIKVQCSGRLGGAEMARTEWYREGQVPLQTLKADIDYGFYVARTTMGVIGVKVWIYKGLIAEPDRKIKEKAASVEKAKVLEKQDAPVTTAVEAEEAEAEEVVEMADEAAAGEEETPQVDVAEEPDKAEAEKPAEEGSENESPSPPAGQPEEEEQEV